MSKNTNTIHKILFGFALLCLFGYGLFTSRFLIQGPEVVLAGMEDSEQNVIYTATKDFSLMGTALHSSFITINNRPIVIDKSGNFNEKLLLSNGVSIIDIYARDKFGKEVRKKIDVVYAGDSPALTHEYNQIALRAQIVSTPIETANASSTALIEQSPIFTQVESEGGSGLDTVLNVSTSTDGEVE